MEETITRLLDDIDGTVAAETVTFTFRGVAYEIDLSKKNIKALDEAIAPFINAARSAKGTRKPAKKAPAKKAVAAAKLDLAAIRAWAVKNGHSVSDRGRIPTAVIDAFHAVQSAVQPPVTKPAAKKAPAKKAAAKKSPAKKAAAKKAPAKRAAKKAAPTPALPPAA